jgi:FtsP/CotA-like multicopper oxidase with cupredoxin domain
MSRASPASHPTHGGGLLYSAALLTLGAATIHFVVAPEHLRKYVPFGLLFLAVGGAQVSLAAEVLARPSRSLALVGGAGSLALVALWAVSRTMGLPIGPVPWTPEDIGLADAICSAMEAGSTLLFLVLAARPPRRRPHTGWEVALGTVPSFVLTLALTGGGVAAATSDMPAAFNAAPAVPGHASTSVARLTEVPGAERVDTFTLTAEVGRIDGQEAWTFNGRVPGPELHVTQGDRVRVPNAEDGVAGLTQDAVPPGRSFTYEFVARDPGTYWYHSHQDTEQQIPRGLFGALVVEPSAGRVVEDRDYTLMLHNMPGSSAIAVNGTTGNVHLAAEPGERVRLRLVNASAPGMDGSPEAPVLLGAPYQVVALDGHDLHAPQVLGPERLPLGMGQRADLVFSMPPSGAVELVDSQLEGQPSLVERFFPAARPAETVTIGDGPVPEPTDPQSLPVFDSTTYGTPAADPVPAGPSDATVPVVLDEGPGFRDGRPELVHTLNGQAAPNVPPITVRDGELVRLHIVNNSGEYHPMHLHGHVLSVLARDGRPIQGSPLHLDTVLVGPHQTWDVAFAADNPGIWMFHCHVLLHAAYGMSLTVNYAGISTPYEMGSRSGNVPE